ncbi:MAG: PKD domain-containing protein [Capsulimonadaceae bacterium]
MLNLLRPTWAAVVLALLIATTVPGHAATHAKKKAHHARGHTRTMANRIKTVRVPQAPSLPNLTATTRKPTVVPKPVAPLSIWDTPLPKLPTISLYNGQDAGKSTVYPGSWGAGSGGFASDVSMAPHASSLKVVTSGLYAGACINFNPPVDLGDRSPARNRTFQILFRFPVSDEMKVGSVPGSGGAVHVLDASRNAPQPVAAVYDSTRPLTAATDEDGVSAGRFQLVQGGPRIPLGPDGRPMFGPGSPNGRQLFIPGARYGMPGGSSPFRQPTSPIGPPPPSAQPAAPPAAAQPANPGNGEWAPPVTTFRIRFTLANGSEAEILRPMPSVREFDDPVTTWRSLAIPLSVLQFPAGQDNSPLKSITIGADGDATVYIGQINLVDDDTPIMCTAGDNQDVAAGDDVTFEGQARGGVSMLNYSWDFNASDGIMDEADGPTVTHEYATGNKDYTATLTVTDIDGIKKPCVSTTVVKVEE